MQINNEALKFLKPSPIQRQGPTSPMVMRTMSEEDAQRKPQVPGQDRVQIAEGVYADMMKPDANAKMSEAVHTKLLTGKPLSDEELSWLKENNPVEYQKALIIKAEREMYKKELENCRSKEDVDKVKQRKLEQFCAEANKIQGSSMSRDDKIKAMKFLEMRRMAIEDEHKTFLDTAKYKNLPQKRKKDDPEPTPQQDDATIKSLMEELKQMQAEGIKGPDAANVDEAATAPAPKAATQAPSPADVAPPAEAPAPAEPLPEAPTIPLSLLA